MSLELQFIKILDTKEKYDLYKPYIEKDIFIPEIMEIVRNIGEWYQVTKQPALDWDSFRIWMRVTKHPTWKQEKKEIYDTIITNAQTTVPSEVLTQSLNESTALARLNAIINNSTYPSFIELIDSLYSEINNYKALHTSSSTETLHSKSIPIDASLVSLELYGSDGLDWSLPEFNKSVGQLHKSDFIIIGKRPETGGTSLLCQQMMHMLHQMPEGKKAIIFHNEEGVMKIAGRLIQVCTGLTAKDIYDDPTNANDMFKKYLKGRNIELYSSDDMSTTDIDAKLSSGEYYLIGINILEKVTMPHRGENYELIGRLAKWARNVAKQYGVVFAIMQADGTAEGECWLTQDQLFNSKTLVQQESDVQIMIGKSNDPINENTRYISIVRNKKPTTGAMDPRWKYAKFELEFDHETGIYKSKL